MNWKKLTAIILVVVVSAISIYDIFAAVYGGDGATVSEVVRAVSYSYPIVPFTLGVVCGHWFWPKK